MVRIDVSRRLDCTDDDCGMALAKMQIFSLLVMALMAMFCAAEVATLDFHGMKIRELKAYIAEKGTECLACSSKEDLIARALEVQDWPDAPKEEEKEKEPTAEEMEKMFKNLNADKERTAKVKEDIRKAGLDPEKFGGHVYSAEDLQKMFKKTGGDAKTEL